MNLAQNIKTARTKAGITQKELAEKIGVYQKDISRWERGERTPSMEGLVKICVALQVSADKLLDIEIKEN